MLIDNLRYIKKVSISKIINHPMAAENETKMECIGHAHSKKHPQDDFEVEAIWKQKSWRPQTDLTYFNIYYWSSSDKKIGTRACTLSTVYISCPI